MRLRERAGECLRETCPPLGYGVTPGLVVSPLAPGLVVSPLTPGEVVSPVVVVVAEDAPISKARASNALKIVSMTFLLS